jgi:ubiquinone/menaquinone biosynthesis C-methylase UbiE
MEDEAKEKIKEYWEDRAKQSLGTPSATTDDIYLRELEIVTIIQKLSNIGVPKQGIVLDVGCGDGYSTLKVAQSIPDMRFFGVDYSENMIKFASERLNQIPELKERVTFAVGDVENLGQVCGSSVYDIVISDRCLINLGSKEDQFSAIAQIANHTKPDGYYIAIENFLEGQENLNNTRRSMELPEISLRWHNLYFKESEFVKNTERFFENIIFDEFSSSYYFATRVIYSKMCQMQGEKPDYKHEIHQLAVHLPCIGQFSPIRMVIMRRKSI